MIGNYLLQVWFKCDVQEHHFVYFLWNNYQLLSKFYDLLLFSPCLIYFRSNSSHCRLMDLFKSKESFKKKVNSDSNWKTKGF